MNPATKERQRPIEASRRSVGSGLLGPWHAYLFAILVTTGTLSLRLGLDAQLGRESILVIFTVPVMLSAFSGGLRAGLVATGLSCLLADYYLLAPIHSFGITSVAERWNLMFVGFAGVRHQRLE